MRNRFVALLAALVLAGASPVAAQRSPAGDGARALVAGITDSALLADLSFRSIGPAVMSGRISDIAVPEVQRAGERWGRVVYVASAAGGVWKTTNAGVTWQPIFDAQRVSSIGAVAVAPSDSSVVYVGTGESNNLRSSSWGEGVYRSSDGGATWSFAGLAKSQHIARIVVHPHHPNTVFVAAMGPLWVGGGERGFFKSTDGGRSWRNTLKAGPYTGVTDIALDPSNADVVYAATYQRDRRAYSFVAGGPESGIWRSTDGGESWTELTSGLPAGDLGRIGIAVARTRPATIYATIHAAGDSSGIYRSDDAGGSWQRVNPLSSIPWFFGQIRVDPQNAERVFHLGVQLSVSDDGGKTFRTIAGQTHADHHAMAIDPHDSDHLLIGNDGGVYTSHDRGVTWDFALNLPVSTFYAVGVDLREPDYFVYGGLQDNGTWGGPVRSRARSGITNSDWVRAGGGDGFYAAIDPTDPNVVYLESQNGALNRFDFATEERKSIRPVSSTADSARYNWSAPLLISPHDHRTLYFGAHVLYRSRDRGDSWERLSGDLTRALNRDSLPIMGLVGPGGLGRHEGTAEFGNISTISESPLRAGLLYVGTDDGLVQVSRDGGATWRATRSVRGVPELTYVSRVAASAHAEGTVYATFDGHRSNDFRPYVLRSDDYGRSFRSIAANLPADGSVYVIREHPRAPGLLFVGTEYGVFVTLDGGGRWTRLDAGDAPAPVHDLVIHPRDNDLVVGTHGRGIFVLDDVTALELLARDGARASRVFAPRPAFSHNLRAGPSTPGDRSYRGVNVQPGATITYFIAADATADSGAVLRILDPSGELIRELPAPGLPGVHRVNWDLRYRPPTAAAPPATGGADEEDSPGAAPSLGPFVYPGSYRVQLHARSGEPATEAPLLVLRDPLVRLAEAEHRTLHELRMAVYSAQQRVHGLIARLDSTQRQLDAALEGKDTASTAASGALPARSELADMLEELRGARGGRALADEVDADANATTTPPVLTRLNRLAAAIGTAHFPPTAEQQLNYRQAASDLTQVAARAEPVIASAAAARDALLRTSNAER